jgi:tRNA nucleotidyltransferase (CCA-adding enzyme)
MSTDAHKLCIKLPPYALAALRVLEEGGHEAWCVGGFVRDALMGREAKDIDIATSARWQVVQRLFEDKGHHSFETGVKHGTLTVLVEQEPLEITTFRNDGAYTDRRRPDSVQFVDDISEDLARRDFTMNALAYNPARGLFDPFGGEHDIAKRTIRAVGDPERRFSEDPLRILRAVRFASQLGFSLEKDSYEAAVAQKGSLAYVAKERIAHELDALFCGDAVHPVLVDGIAIISAVIPEALALQGFDQKTPYHVYDVLEHTAWCMRHCPPDPLVRWAAFFHDMGKPKSFSLDEAGTGHFYGHATISAEIAGLAMKRLKMSPSFIRDVVTLVTFHDDLITESPRAIKRMLRRLGESPRLFRALCALKRGDALAQAPRCHGRAKEALDLEAALDRMLAAEEAFSLKDLAIGGRDILALGVKPGPMVGALLERALEATIEGEVPNTHAELLSFLAVPIEAARDADSSAGRHDDI